MTIRNASRGRQITGLGMLILLIAAGALAVPGPEQQKVALANASFAFSLLKEIAKEQPAQNIFLSPYSLSTALHMVSHGAGGQTKAEMQRVLGTGGLNLSAVDQANQASLQSLSSLDTNITLTIANALWYRKGISVKPDFLSRNQAFFGAKVDALDFNDPAATGIINSWAKEQTHGRIPTIVSGPFSPLVRMFLANAVYFKGKWLSPFEPKDTKDRAFHVAATRQKTVPMMHKSHDFTYRRGTGYQAVRLEYQDSDLAMYVFLPDPGSSPEKLLAIMNGDTWHRITLPGFSEKQGTLMLPRFKLEFGIDLRKSLAALGMKSAFIPERASFPGISDEPLFIGAASQRAFVEVNEEGTEAAAVTMLAWANKSELDPPKPFEMIVDRPFLFIIHHRPTNTILFMGLVQDPPAAD